MGKIGVVEVRRQEGMPPPKRPPDGTQVWMAIDISRSKAVYCLRWDGSEQRRLSTPLGIEPVRAVLAHYHGCQVHVAYEACGFGYELAWWLVDGISGVDVATVTMRTTPDATIEPPRPWHPRRVPSGVELLRDDVRERTRVPLAQSLAAASANVLRSDFGELCLAKIPSAGL